MTDPSSNEHIEDWVLAYLDGELDAESFAKLSQTLRDHPSAIDRFVELAMLDRSVLESLTQSEEVQAMHHASLEHADPALSFEATLALLARGSESAQMVRVESESHTLHRFTPYLIGGAIAAVLVLAVTLTFVFQPGNATLHHTASTPSAQPTKNETVATLTAQHSAQWVEGALAPGSPIKTGSPLHAGQTLTLTAGFAEITTASGAVAILEAPATVELLDQNNALRLHTGKLVGICETESSKGLLVRTPHMDVTDLGTRFGVHVEDAFSQPTHVQVFQGSVRMQSLAAETVTLFAGQAKAAGAEGLVDALFDESRYAQAVTGRVELADMAANPFGIANPSFEWVALEDGKLSRKEVPGWTLSNPKAAVVANPGQGVTLYYDPALALDANGGTVGDMHGRCLFFFSYDQTGASLSQTLATQAEVGTTYTLTVAIGDRMDKAVYRSDFAGYNIELLAGDQVLASLNASPDQSPGQGTFTDVALTYTVQPGDPTGPLGIRLSTNRANNEQVTDFDNIRLTASRITGARRTE